MSDLIERQAAIDALKTDASFVMFDDHGNYTADGLRILEVLTALPSAQHYDEWCTDCKEYDHERHCCPRWNKVIREALKDAQPEVIRCKDCKYHTHMWYCEAWNNSPGFPAVSDDMFCSLAERREDG